MSNGLPVSNVVDVDINLSPTAAVTRDFGSLLVLGTSDALNPNEGIVRYDSPSAVASTFGTLAPEYKAAVAFFSQRPQPDTLYVTRWARTATSGKLKGAVLTPTEQDVSRYSVIDDGSLTITINGDEQALTAIDLTGVSSLQEVAAAVQAQITGDVTVLWDPSSQRFVVTSGTSGVESTVEPSVVPGSGVDLGPMLAIDSGSETVQTTGTELETLVDAATRLASESSDWYGMTVAASDLDDQEVLETAAFIEAAVPSRIFGVTTDSSDVITSTVEDDIASQLMDAGYARTFIQYSRSNPYAVVSAIARAFTVDYTGQNTVITLKFKQEPGVIAEDINSTQAQTLDGKNVNVFVKYANDTAIIQQGVMCNGDYFDERHGLDWLQNYLQTNLFNLLYTSQTKVPQTDSGVNLLLTNVEGSCAQAVVNGLLAPGVWDSSVQFGGLRPGDTLPKGYYAYAPPVASQAKSDREARKAPPIQVAAKLAGAVHYANVVVNVNR